VEQTVLLHSDHCRHIQPAFRAESELERHFYGVKHCERVYL